MAPQTTPMMEVEKVSPPRLRDVGEELSLKHFISHLESIWIFAESRSDGGDRKSIPIKVIDLEGM